MIEPLSLDELRSGPSTVDIVTAGRAVGVGRTKAHQMARTGTFPVRVLVIGKRYRVSTAELCSFLGIPVTGESGDVAA